MTDLRLIDTWPEYYRKYLDWHNGAYIETQEIQGAVFTGIEDCYGYLRWLQTGELIHRIVARELIYPYGHFTMEFEFYDVHHIDRNKKNNQPYNLAVLTREEHEAVHGRRFDSIDDYF